MRTNLSLLPLALNVLNNPFSGELQLALPQNLISKYALSIGSDVCVFLDTLTQFPAQLTGTCLACNSGEISVDLDLFERYKGPIKVSKGSCTIPKTKSRPQAITGEIVIIEGAKFKLSPTQVISASFKGGYKNALQTLQLAQVTDKYGHWIAKDSIFVQLGNMANNNGNDTTKLVHLMMNLANEAAAAGGKVVPLIGQSEMLNLRGDYSQSTMGDIKVDGGAGTRLHIWSPDGPIGKYYQSVKIAAKVGDTVFFSSGASVEFSAQTVIGLNREAKVSLAKPRSIPRHGGIFGIDGPLQYTDYTTGPASYDCSRLKQALKLLGASRMVVGNNPNPSSSILTRCKGSFLNVDVGADSAALIINAGKVYGIPHNID